MAGLPHHPYRKQAFAAAVISWLMFVWFLCVVDPVFVANLGWESSYLPFYVLLLLSIGFLLWGLTGRWKEAGLWTFIICIGVWLRMNQLDSLLNIVLLISFGVVWEYYWRLSQTHNLIN